MLHLAYGLLTATMTYISRVYRSDGNAPVPVCASSVSRIRTRGAMTP
jgi:hypothetical protein